MNTNPKSFSRDFPTNLSDLQNTSQSKQETNSINIHSHSQSFVSSRNPHSHTSNSILTKPDSNVWSFPNELLEKFNELNSVKDLSRPLPSIPIANPKAGEDKQALSIPPSLNQLQMQGRGPNVNLEPSPNKPIGSKTDTIGNPSEAYSSNEEWSSPENMLPRRIVENKSTAVPAIKIQGDNVAHLIANNQASLGRFDHLSSSRQSSERKNLHGMQDIQSILSRVDKILDRKNSQQKLYQQNDSEKVRLSRDKSAPHLRSSSMSKQDDDILNSRNNGNSSSLSPLGHEKFKKLGNKSLFRMNSKDSLHSSTALSFDPNQSTNIQKDPLESSRFLRTEGSLKQLMKSGDHEEKKQSSFTKENKIPESHLDYARNLPLYKQDQTIIDKTKILTFNGGSLFPPTQTKDSKSPLILLEADILNRFRDLEEDVRPYFEVVVSTLPKTLVLEKPRHLLVKGTDKPKINLFNPNSSPHATQTRVSGKSLEFRNLVEKRLSDKFFFLHALPFVDAFSCRGEFYLVINKENQSILILKILHSGELGSQDPTSVIILSLKVADSTLSQLIQSQKKIQEKFQVQELRSLFHDCITSLYTLQKEGQIITSLHPDFILFDQSNQIFYILPVDSPYNYSSKDPDTYLHSLSKYRSSQSSNSSAVKTPVLGHPDYISPKLRESLDHNLNECEHNPYKSCLFSLGMVLLEAFTLQSPRNLNKSKILLNEKVVKNPLYIMSSILGKDYTVQSPNILSILLNFDEESRPDFVLLYFRIFDELPTFEDPLHPRYSLPIFDTHIKQQVELSKRFDSVKITLSFTKGQKYVGQVVEYHGHLVRQGQGSFYDEHGDLVFQGIWNQDFPQQGIYVYNQDYKYEGTWNGFSQDGKGILYYKNNPLYEGEWRKFKYQGKGKLYYDDGSVMYEGEFKLSMKSGHGRSYYKNGNVSHIGCYKQDRMNGPGNLYWPNGNLKFEGDIISNEVGQVYLKGDYYAEKTLQNNGTVYEGELFEDRYHGKGSLYDLERNLFASGDWVHGEFQPTYDNPWQKEPNTLKSYSHIKGVVGKEFKQFNGEINLKNSHLDIATREIQLYLETHTQNPEISVDLSNVDVQQFPIVIQILSNNPHLRGVKDLILNKSLDQQSPYELKNLFESPNLQHLNKLSILNANEFCDLSCQVLSESTTLKYLYEFSVIDSRFSTDQGIINLLSSPIFSNLEILRIKNSFNIREQAILNSLVNPYHLQNLQKLSLTGCSLTPESLKILFNTNNGVITHISKLNLSQNMIGNKGCQYIMEAKIKLEKLTKLSMKNCEIGASGASFLCNSPCLSPLASLDLSFNPISSAGCDFIFSSRIFSRLEILKLKECNLGLQAIKKMSENSVIKNLATLELDNNKALNNESMEYLASNPNLANLELLSLVGISISIKGVEKLCQSSILNKLKTLKIFGNEVGKLVGQEIQKQIKIRKNLDIL